MSEVDKRIKKYVFERNNFDSIQCELVKDFFIELRRRGISGIQAAKAFDISYNFLKAVKSGDRHSFTVVIAMIHFYFPGVIFKNIDKQDRVWATFQYLRKPGESYKELQEKITPMFLTWLSEQIKEKFEDGSQTQATLARMSGCSLNFVQTLIVGTIKTKTIPKMLVDVFNSQHQKLVICIDYDNFVA